MKIQVKSDLHWENKVYSTVGLLGLPEERDEYIHQEAEVLILAGDIINAKEYHIDYLLHKFRKATKPILYVPGNHEYWGVDFHEGRERLKKKLSGTNITLLDKDSMIIKSLNGEDVLFVGATLWTSLSNPNKAMIATGTRDFREIKNFNVNVWDVNHISELHFIERTLDFQQYRDLKKVVISHYLPSNRSVPERFQGNAMNCIFVADDMEAIIRLHQPNLYVHGHTHDKNDYKIGKTKVISNPKGRMTPNGSYENWQYDNELIIEI